MEAAAAAAAAAAPGEGGHHLLRRFGMVLYFAAITCSFSVYSLAQERLMTVGFGPSGERFTHSVFVVLVNRLVTIAVAAAALAALRGRLAPAAPLALFAVPSLANLVASSAQYEALKYVSFPLQALSKCVKTLPVMAWGAATRSRAYSRADVGVALAATAGCALFVLTGDLASPAARAGGAPPPAGWTAAGLGLLAAFLAFDGLTSTSQDALFGRFREMHPLNQLLYTSGWSAAAAAAALGASGQLRPAAGFVGRHPAVLWLLLAQSGASCAVQVFILGAIRRYGALAFALMMTARQFLSIVLSCLVFGHRLSAAQWAGAALVVGALGAQPALRARRGAEAARHAKSRSTADLALAAAEAAAAADGEGAPLLPAVHVGRRPGRAPASGDGASGAPSPAASPAPGSARALASPGFASPLGGHVASRAAAAAAAGGAPKPLARAWPGSSESAAGSGWSAGGG